MHTSYATLIILYQTTFLYIYGCRLYYITLYLKLYPPAVYFALDKINSKAWAAFIYCIIYTHCIRLPAARCSSNIQIWIENKARQ